MGEAQTVSMLGLIAGVLGGSAMLTVGLRLRYFEAYEWVAGYNIAPPEERERYDIEGLAHHLGNGLVTLGVLTFAASLSFYLAALRWLGGIGLLWFAVVFIMVVGGQKFRPHPAGAPAHTHQRFLKWLLPANAFAAIERGTHDWVIECRCGNLRDYWDAGGVRYKAVGERREFSPCERCGKVTWQKLRRLRDGDVVNA